MPRTITLIVLVTAFIFALRNLDLLYSDPFGLLTVFASYNYFLSEMGKMKKSVQDCCADKKGRLSSYFGRLPDEIGNFNIKDFVLKGILFRLEKDFCSFYFVQWVIKKQCCTARTGTKGCAGFLGMIMFLVIIRS